MAGYDYGGGPAGDWPHGRHPLAPGGGGGSGGGDSPYRMDQEQASRAPPPPWHNGGHGNQTGRPPASPALSAADTDTESRRSGERNRSRPRGSRSASGQVRTCRKCGEPLTGQFVRALDGTFHLDCFRCRVSPRCLTPPTRFLADSPVIGLWPDCGFQVLPGR